MRDVVSDMAAYMVGRAIPAALGFAVVAIFVRMMGERDYGLYSIVLSGANFAAILSVGWLSQAILRFRPAEQEWTLRFGKLVARGIRRACAFGVAASAALLLATSGRISEPIAIGASCLLVLGLILQTVYLASLQATFRSRTVAAMEIVRALIAVPAGVLGIMTIHPAYAGAIVGIGVSYVVEGLWARHLTGDATRAKHSESRDLRTGASLRALLTFGWPVSLWLGVSMAFPFVERSLIQLYLGAGVTGQYAALYDVVYRSAGFAMMPVVLAVHPRIMKAHDLGRRTESHRLWGGGLAVQIILALGVVATMTVACRWIIAAIGLRFTHALASLILPLAAAGAVWQMALIAHKLLEAHQRTRRMLAFLFAALVADAIVDAALLPIFGLQAAAYALLGTGVLYVVCVGIEGVRLTGRGVALARPVQGVTPAAR